MERISEIKKTAKINGLIISAGLSGRMKQFKPLMDFEGLPFIVQIIKKMSPVCSIVNIVTGHLADELQRTTENILEQMDSQLPAKINWIYNPNYKKGMFTSLQSGVKEAEKCDWLLYHFVDQPGIPDTFYTDFIREADDRFDWIQPEYRGKHGHPVLLNNFVMDKIITANEDENLNIICNMKNIRKKYYNCNYAQVLQDFDTPQDIVNFKLSEL